MFVYSSVCFDCLCIYMLLSWSICFDCLFFVADLSISALQGYGCQGCMRWISGMSTSTRHDVSTAQGYVYTQRIQTTSGSAGSGDCYHGLVCWTPSDMSVRAS